MNETVATFADWFRQSERRFLVHLIFEEATDDAVHLLFNTGTPILAVSLTSWSLDVLVLNPDDPDDVWDILISFEAAAQCEDGRWFCGLCCDNKDRLEPLKYYSNREDLLRDHMFDPFLNWTNTNLARAAAIDLHGQVGDARWARLSGGEPGDCTYRVWFTRA
jgi:hypothetical protein